MAHITTPEDFSRCPLFTPCDDYLPAEIPPSKNLLTTSQQVGLNVQRIVLAVASGALLGACLGGSASGGAIFGITYGASKIAANAVIKKFNLHSPTAQGVVQVVAFVACITLAFLAASAAGYPITTASLIALPFTMCIVSTIMLTCQANLERKMRYMQIQSTLV